LSDLALEGDLHHFIPAEVLQLLQLAQANGRLELERARERVELFIERGRPVFARTSGASVRAGEVLVHRGLLTPEALERALAAQRERPGERLGTRLVASGAISPEQLQLAVREVLRRIVYGVLLWRDGRFRFHPGQRVEAEDIQLDLELDRLILEGLRHADQIRAAG
jgi:glycine/D-amino acid oxidase-like deaminating enzyme